MMGSKETAHGLIQIKCYGERGGKESKRESRPMLVLVWLPAGEGTGSKGKEGFWLLLSGVAPWRRGGGRFRGSGSLFLIDFVLFLFWAWVLWGDTILRGIQRKQS